MVMDILILYLVFALNFKNLFRLRQKGRLIHDYYQVSNVPKLGMVSWWCTLQCSTLPGALVIICIIKGKSQSHLHII